MKDKKKVGIGVGIAALLAVIGAWLWTGKAKPAPPPPPPPGLANLYGKVTDADTGKAVSNVYIALDSKETYTDYTGNYSFLDIQPGEYSIIFIKEGYETLEL